jgi:hypothetical protein
MEDTAEEVFDAVTSLSIDALHGRAGRKTCGRIEPTEAVWEFLGQASSACRGMGARRPFMRFS